MTLYPGKRELCGLSGMIYLTQTEKKEIDEFMRQYGGQFVITESDHYKDSVASEDRNTFEDPADDGYSGDT